MPVWYKCQTIDLYIWEINVHICTTYEECALKMFSYTKSCRHSRVGWGWGCSSGGNFQIDMQPEGCLVQSK